MEKRLINRRQIWAANRFWMELDNMKTKRYGNKGRHHWQTLLMLMRIFKFCLQVTGCYERGVRNAMDFRLQELELTFSNLPKSFHGFTILHLRICTWMAGKGLRSRSLPPSASARWTCAC